jgi:hypothetical protein
MAKTLSLCETAGLRMAVALASLHGHLRFVRRPGSGEAELDL